METAVGAASSRWRAPAAVFVVALVVSLLRWPYRWNPIALAYIAYFRETRRIVDHEGGIALLTTWTGAHPPAYGWLAMALLEGRAPPALWLILSALLSSLGAALVTLACARSGMRGAMAAGLLLALSPHRTAYALEANDYPLLICAIGLAYFGFARAADGARWGALAAGSALAMLTHTLLWPLCAAMGLLALRLRGAALRGVLVAAPFAVLLLPGVSELLAHPPINEAAPIGDVLRALAIDGPSRYGPYAGAVAVAAAALLSVRSARSPLFDLAWLHLLLGLLLTAYTLRTGAASVGQTPYLLAAIPPVCVLAGAAWGRGGAGPIVVSLVLSFGWQGREAWRAFAAAEPASVATMERAVDAWDERGYLVLIGMTDAGDDDKDVLDPQYRRLSPFRRIASGEPPVDGITGADPYWGQPFRLDGDRWLFTFTAIAMDRLDAIAASAARERRPLIVFAYGGSRDEAGMAALSARFPVREDGGDFVLIVR